MRFAWDPRKAKSNLVKHGISFDEAQTAFLDDNARIIDDPDHSAEEGRFVLLGYSLSARCLVGSHCLRDSGSVIRIISARRARQVRRSGILELSMRQTYEFSKSRKNPYAKQLKRQITIRLDLASVDYFKQLAASLGMPYQNLINLYLRDCAQAKRRPSIEWLPNPTSRSSA